MMSGDFLFAPVTDQTVDSNAVPPALRTYAGCLDWPTSVSAQAASAGVDDTSASAWVNARHLRGAADDAIDLDLPVLL